MPSKPFIAHVEDAVDTASDYDLASVAGRLVERAMQSSPRVAVAVCLASMSEEAREEFLAWAQDEEWLCDHQADDVK